MKFRHSAAVLALAAAMGASPLMFTPPAAAAAPMARTPAPGFYRLQVGDFEVTALSDGTVDLAADKVLSAPAPRVDAALARAFLGEPVESSINAFLVNTGGKLILVDAGSGVLYGPTLGRLMANLKASGYAPDQVDDIYLTHLHPDHVGGLVDQGGRAFPNATIHVARREAEFWSNPANLAKTPDASKATFQGASTSLAGYIRANRFQPFDEGTSLGPGLRAVPSHGHTPGHTSYLIESRGQRLFVVGDLVHVGAVQLPDPKVTIAFDSDPGSAIRSREALFSQAVREDDLVAAAHMPFPGLGHLRENGGGFEWVPVNYTQPR